MSAKTTIARKAGSAVRGPRALERLLIVAAIAAVLVSVGAWVALNRPWGGAEAAGAESSTSTSHGTAGGTATATDAATGAAADAATGDQGAAAQSSAAQASAAQASAAQASAGQASAGQASGAAAGKSGSGATGRPGTPAATTAVLSPTTAFLTALTASGLAPPVDDAQKLAMAQDVCQEMGYGSKYADVVRALTFAGATDAEAANFAKLAITNICPQYKAS